MVKIRGCAAAGDETCNRSEGSGAIIHPRGLILTALHVVVTNPNDLDSPLLPEVSVGMLPGPDSDVEMRYRASVAAIAPNLDLALLWLMAGAEEDTLLLPTLPLEAMENGVFRNSPQMRALGFLAGDNRLKLPPPDFVGTNAAGAVEMASNIVGQGFSGGPLVVERGERWHLGGVVFYRTGNTVLVQPLRLLQTLRWPDDTLPRLWVEKAADAEADRSSRLPELTLRLNVHAVDLDGRELRLEVLAFDSATNQPWPSPAEQPLRRTFTPTRFVDVVSFDLSMSLAGQTAIPDRLGFEVKVWDTDEARVLWQGEIFYLVPERNQIAFVPTPTQTNTPLPPTATPTPVPTETPTTIPPTPTHEGTQINAVRVTLTEWTNIFEGPGSTFPFVRLAAPEEQLLVDGTNADTSWYRFRSTETMRSYWFPAEALSGQPEPDVLVVLTPILSIYTPTVTSTPTLSPISTPNPKPTQSPLSTSLLKLYGCESVIYDSTAKRS